MALLPRDTINAIKPQTKALATAEETAARQAMFENGSNLVKKPRPQNPERIAGRMRYAAVHGRSGINS